MINFSRIIYKPYSSIKAVWLSVFIGSLLFFISCSKDDTLHKTSLFLKKGVGYTADGASVPVGGQIRLGIQASGAGAALTYLRIYRITSVDTLTQVDRGIYAGREGYNADFVFSKDTSLTETWVVSVMNADRVITQKSLTILRGSGTAYGELNYYPSILFGLQANTSLDHYLDVDRGVTYNQATITGHEAEIDLLCYYYVTSGLPSPSFTCPGYTAAVGFYPELATWPQKSTTLFDYRSTDNNLVTVDQFDSAMNDSLLVTAYKPDKVSGNCKYCYTGKIVPFKTDEGKYGLVKVIRADEAETGSIEVAIKVQK